jgi:hypothetical protein
MMGKRLLWIVLFALALAGCGGLGGLIGDVGGVGGDVTIEASETQGVVVEGVPTLVVNHFAGNVVVRDGEAGRIAADLTKQSRLPDEAEAQAQLEQIVMSFTQQGTDVTLTIEGPDNLAEAINAPRADLELLVPPGTRLTITQGAGDVTVERPSGDVAINLGAGNATVRLPEDATFRLVMTGGVAEVKSEFEGVPSGGLAADIDVSIGGSPTQTLTFDVVAGEVRLEKAP